MVIFVEECNQKKSPWLIPKNCDIQLYTLYYTTKKDLQKKLAFLQKRVPVYGMLPPSPPFLGLLCVNSMRLLLRNGADSLCLKDESGDHVEFAQWAVEHVRHLRVVSTKPCYLDLAQKTYRETGAVITISTVLQRDLAVDADQGVIYLKDKGLSPVSFKDLNTSLLYGDYCDKNQQTHSADVFVFENQKQVTLDFLNKIIC